MNHEGKQLSESVEAQEDIYRNPAKKFGAEVKLLGVHVKEYEVGAYRP